jgi:serine/threonine protein phosphatase 1
MTAGLLKLRAGDTLYLLGDYIDRGPDSKDVIDHIFELKDAGVIVHTLRGNHEEMFLKALRQRGEALEHWLRSGGDATLKSFGLHYIEEIATLSESSLPIKYIDFFNDLEYYIETESYFLVHAGFNFTAPDPLTDHQSMLWIRNMQVDDNFLKGKKVIFGHTPRTIGRIKDSLSSQLINIDGGCVYADSPTGHLVALNLETLELIHISCMD